MQYPGWKWLIVLMFLVAPVVAVVVVALAVPLVDSASTSLGEWFRIEWGSGCLSAAGSCR